MITDNCSRPNLKAMLFLLMFSRKCKVKCTYATFKIFFIVFKKY